MSGIGISVVTGAAFVASGALLSANPVALGVYGITSMLTHTFLNKVCRIHSLISLPLGFIASYYLLAALGVAIPFSFKVLVVSFCVSVTCIIAFFALIAVIIYLRYKDNPVVQQMVAQMVATQRNFGGLPHGPGMVYFGRAS